ncbi:MAG: hypothetical protein FD147_881 [Chloroflexi bacterium]|nr:MAG: hypothetical protein FD147_881 [Chloroflexota bacterium]
MTDIFHFLSWYLVILLIGVVTFPIAFRFFPRLTSKGYALARPLGLLLWGYVFWLLGSLGILQNDLGGVILAFVILPGAAIWGGSGGKWNEILAWIKTNWKSILTMELLFFIAFGLWAVVRAANPDVAYTEKPMELAFINSILKSPSFPLHDPWLSGYSISYYYFGYVLIAMLTRVTGVASSIAFNLSSALWFALTALAVYGIVFDLIATWKYKAKSLIINEQKPDVLKLARIGGLLGPFFVLIISCLEGVLELLYSGGVFWKENAEGTLVSKFWTWLSISELDVAPTLPFDWIPSRPASWMWWRGSRVLQDLSLANVKIEIIDEFPFFSYLLSDLHPHVLAMPFGLLALGVCLNLFLGAKEFYPIKGSFFFWLKRWEFWLTALILGSLAFINTWDFPIYVGLFCLVLAFSRSVQLGWSWRRVGEFLKSGFLIGITGIFLFLPFYLGFKSQAGGFLPSMEYMTRGVHFWILFGALLTPIFIWLFFQVRQMEEPKRLLQGLKFAFILFVCLWLFSTLFGILLLSLNQIGPTWAVSSNNLIAFIGNKFQIAGQAFSGLHGFADVETVTRQSVLRRLTAPGTWLTLAVMLTATWGLLSGKIKKPLTTNGAVLDEIETPAQSPRVKYFVLILILVGIALTTFPEFFYLRDQFGSRMNTIFKFYFQAWIIWGIAAAYASVELLTRLRGWKSWIFNVVWVVTILGGLAYPVIMILEKTNHFKPVEWTLDGNAYLLRGTPDEYAAMEWLSKVPLGVVAEAVGGSYTDYARVSTRTGLSTVLGWPGHEGQWRGGYEEVGSRQSDIELLYKTNSWTETQYLIQKYNIRYIYIGNLEHSLYQPDLDKFRAVLDLVYGNSSVKIYEVPASVGELTQ